MAQVKDFIDTWAIEEVRGDTQVNKKVLLGWFNKGLHNFQKKLLEYVSGKHNTGVVFRNIEKDKDQYRLPEFDSTSNVQDFYSIVQLRVAYHKDKNGNPMYRVCEPIDFTDYNITPMKNKWETDAQWNERLVARWGIQKWEPYVWDVVSERTPKYIFVPKYEKIDDEHPNTKVWHNDIKIFPTPIEDVPMGLTLTYNFIQKPVELTTELWKLNLPWYVLDAIEDYMTFRLYQAENPELAQYYKQQYEDTLEDNIYWLNKDKRPLDEWFANTTYFSHN